MIRPLVPTDLDVLVALETAAAHKPWTPTALAGVLAEPRSMGWLLPDTAYLFGHRVLDEAEIYSVGVHPSARRSGQGRMLVAHALACWRAAGVATVHLEVRADNLAALGLYGSLGFCTTGRRVGYYDDCDALLMAVTP